MTILLLKVKGEDTLTYENSTEDAKRPFLLIIRQADKSVKKLDIYEDERPIGIQIFGSDFDALAIRANLHPF